MLRSRFVARIAGLDLSRLDALPGCQYCLIQGISFIDEKTGNLNRRALEEVQSHRWCCGDKPPGSVSKLDVFDVTQWESFPAKWRLENYIVVCDANRQRLPCKADDRENNENDAENAETRNKQRQRRKWQCEECRDPQNSGRFPDDNCRLISWGIHHQTRHKIRSEWVQGKAALAVRQSTPKTFGAGSPG